MATIKKSGSPKGRSVKSEGIHSKGGHAGTRVVSSKSAAASALSQTSASKRGVVKESDPYTRFAERAGRYDPQKADQAYAIMKDALGR